MPSSPVIFHSPILLNDVNSIKSPGIIVPSLIIPAQTSAAMVNPIIPAIIKPLAFSKQTPRQNVNHQYIVVHFIFVESLQFSAV